VSFVWKTSYVGYPNLFTGETDAHQLGDFFRLIADAAGRGISYGDLKKEAKTQFNVSGHQTETKKAAFQEFGLAYVAPRSDLVSLTPAGTQLFDLARTSASADAERRKVLLLLGRALARYQFQNPFPAGARQAWAESTDVLPYLATYYLLTRLDGLITTSELFGAVFGLQRMRDLPALAERIANHRKDRRRFNLLAGLPSDSRTLANLKIYFMAHLGLDWEILRDERANFYGFEEQCYELTEAGLELIDTILNEEWPNWRRSGQPPKARVFGNIAEYFTTGVGAACSGIVFERDSKLATRVAKKISAGVLTPEDVESLQNLPKRSFKEGRKKLVTHVRAERNQTLVREAKRQFKNRHGRLYCEACDFEFLTSYGERGRDFIEAHHSKPISTLSGQIPTTINDLEMVCSNCHRMLHRKPWISVQELRTTLSGTRPVGPKSQP
jgi:DNA-binding MarR family transcriptional regulator